jgi:hypothetical protein
MNQFLDEVVRAAAESGTAIQYIQRLPEKEADMPRLQFTTHSKALLAAIADSCHVAAGTAWLWAHAESILVLRSISIATANALARREQALAGHVVDFEPSAVRVLKQH